MQISLKQLHASAKFALYDHTPSFPCEERGIKCGQWIILSVLMSHGAAAGKVVCKSQAQFLGKLIKISCGESAEKRECCKKIKSRITFRSRSTPRIMHFHLSSSSSICNRKTTRCNNSAGDDDDDKCMDSVTAPTTTFPNCCCTAASFKWTDAAGREDDDWQ
jgi:hypothetical protein